MTLWKNFNQAAKAHDANEGIGSESDELNATLQRYWNVRSHPAGYSGSFTAANSGFTLLDSSSQPCTTACPQLVISLPAAAGTATMTVLTQCVAPGSIAGLKRLRELNFANAMATACLQCGSGTIPVVTFTSSASDADNRRFPHNGAASPRTFQMNGILGMSLCFDQTATNPLAMDLRAYLLDPHASTDALAVSQHASLLPFDNFANVRLEAGP